MGWLIVTQARSMQHQLGPISAKVKDQTYSNLVSLLSWTPKPFNFSARCVDVDLSGCQVKPVYVWCSAFPLLCLLVSLESKALLQDLFWRLHNQHWDGAKKPSLTRVGVCCWLLYFIPQCTMLQENWLVQYQHGMNIRRQHKWVAAVSSDPECWVTQTRGGGDGLAERVKIQLNVLALAENWLCPCTRFSLSLP